MQTPRGGGGLLDDELFSVVTSKHSPSLEVKITHTAAAMDTAHMGVGVVANTHVWISIELLDSLRWPPTITGQQLLRQVLHQDQLYFDCNATTDAHNSKPHMS